MQLNPSTRLLLGTSVLLQSTHLRTRFVFGAGDEEVWVRFCAGVASPLPWCHSMSLLLPCLELLKVEGSLFVKRERCLLDRITETQNGRGWKGPLWVI